MSQHSQVSCSWNPLNNFIVIPGKLAIPPEADQPEAEVSATRNLPPLRLLLSKRGEIQWVLDTRFRRRTDPSKPCGGFAGMTVGSSLISFADFGSKVAAVKSKFSPRVICGRTAFLVV
jgi:hypothetical protein